VFFFGVVEACTRGVLRFVSAQASLPVDSADLKPSVVEEEQLYDCFSPYGRRGLLCRLPPWSEGMDEILAPVLQIAP
jgi:hypothetical protein